MLEKPSDPKTKFADALSVAETLTEILPPVDPPCVFGPPSLCWRLDRLVVPWVLLDVTLLVKVESKSNCSPGPEPSVPKN